MWHFYTIEYYTVVKKNNDILKFGGKWMGCNYNEEPKMNTKFHVSTQ